MSSTDIHAIKDAIKECDLRIEALTDQLKAAQEERQGWERKLSFALTKGPNYVNKCTVEILVEIFRMYLTPRHQHIGTLLLVCKKWYELIMKTPSLWNCIDLYFDGPPEVDEPLCLVPYVEACKQRSENLKLDINLDLKMIGNAKAYHISVLESVLDECSDCLLDTLTEIIDDQDPSRHSCSVFNQRMKEMVDTMRVLVGDDSKDMARWSSFHIALPEGAINWVIPSICSLFDGPTDSLLNVTIEGLGGWVSQTSWNPDLHEFPGPKDWPKVERLIVKMGCINSIPVEWPPIKHLSIVVDRLSDLSGVSKLTSLESLALTISSSNSSGLKSFRKAQVKHHFPSLHTLKMVGWLFDDWFDAFKLNVPSLKNFSMELSAPSSKGFNMQFPNVSPRNITFRTHEDSESGYRSQSWNKTDSQKAVSQVLHHFSSAEQIIFEGFSDKIIRTVLSDRTKTRQRCPTSVYTEKDGDFSRLHYAPAIISS
jgi:hypothetical protein